MKYELTLERYQGPLDKLLELVEEKKLAITEISLAEVTADFLNYLEKLEKEHSDPTLISDFLVVASKLVLIKSKILLPTLELNEEEEEDIRTFEKRLLLYAELKKAKNIIKEKWNVFPQMASREFLSTIGAAFYPPKNLTAEDLALAFSKIFREFEKVMKPVKTIKIEMINLKEKIEEILKKITSKKPVELNNLRSEGSRSELIVLFLAILHLIKAQLIYVEQAGHFSEIKITKLK